MNNTKSTHQIKALIIDDEPLAHDVITHYLKTHNDIQVCAKCTDATQALQYLAANTVDLLFLDINMPGLSGIEMLKVLGNKPQVVIISAYSEYAIAGFELAVTDYLLKPVSEARFNTALDKVRQMLSLDKAKLSKENTSPLDDSIVLKVGRDKHKIILDHIGYLEAYGNYVKVWQMPNLSDEHTPTMLLANTTLKELLNRLPNDAFIQIHKSYVVNKKHITGQTNQTIQLTGDVAIKVGKSYKEVAKRVLEII